MARTAEMRLLELMVLKEDISSVLEYIGKSENFQFQTKLKESSSTNAGIADSDDNPAARIPQTSVRPKSSPGAPAQPRGRDYRQQYRPPCGVHQSWAHTGSCPRR